MVFGLPKSWQNASFNRRFEKIMDLKKYSTRAVVAGLHRCEWCTELIIVLTHRTTVPVPPMLGHDIVLIPMLVQPTHNSGLSRFL